MAENRFAKYLAGAENTGTAPVSGNRFAKYVAPEMALDYDKPITELRKDIEKLPPTSQEEAFKLYARRYVEKERQAGFQPLPEAALGIPLIGGWLDEAAAAVESIPNVVSRAVKTIQPGVPEVGGRYDENLAIQRERMRQSEAANPALAATSQIAAGITTGGPIFSRIPAAATTAGRITQGVAVGAPLGFAEGFSRGEGSVGDRIDRGTTEAGVGAVVGGALPIAGALATRAYGAVADAVSPQITRMRFGPEAAADEIIARRMAAEGSSALGKMTDLNQGRRSAQLNSNSRATLPEALVDSSDEMQRLGGSVYRAGGEAGNLMRTNLETRQRGPANPYEPQPAGAPQGQMNRVIDATERALLIRTADSARRTDAAIMRQQAQEGRRLYTQAYQQSQAFDLQPVLDGLALQAQQYPRPFRARLNRALELFRDDSTPQRMPVNTVARFDAAKKALDDEIEKAQRAGSNNLVRLLTEFKNDLLGAVHANGRNAVYAQARQTWGSAAENRQAIELGRAALRENSEVSIEQFRDLTEGQQRLFRIGFVESLRNAMGTKKPGNDVTQLFQQRRVQELMSEIIPTPNSRNAVYANRPQRFGDIMAREERMVQTRNQVLGGSPTAQRQQDDAALAGDALTTMWNRFRSAPSLFNVGMEAVGSGLQRVFGYRQDVAVQIARRLLETNPQERARYLRRLQRQYGPDAFTEFARFVDQANQGLARSAPAAISEQRDGAR